MLTLTNRFMTVAFKTAGAELTSIRAADGTEYLWQGDPAVWGRQAPILFPIVGRLVGDRYIYGGQSYAMGQHGFARDREFCVKFHTEWNAMFELVSDDASRAIYPFDFSLVIDYALVHNMPRLSVDIVVTNTGKVPLPFSFGIHPAFRCPVRPGESFEDYELVFDRPLSGLRQTLRSGLRVSNEPFFDDTERLAMSAQLFKDDAIIIENSVPRVCELRPRGGGPGISLETTRPGHWPYYGIWSKPDRAGKHHFVCLEPWFGLPSRADEGPELTTKEGVLELPVGDQAIFSYHFDLLP